ncbi:PTS system mannose/fructose/sorbose family transporter subunit IID [uncultured Mitsuokella sp.]|uniref:PTS system mannose/fructose/sorbose family transporter subunit IID n=1 Tax=uncultured Mitsuokella sp. TaxID=453120 RepID=UPI0026DAD598|nr:mannose/fructose/sorbose PTS transporter subunit IID [uncultured Mitsuokella sp.]
MEKVKLTKGDLVNMFIRSNFQQASFNFERIHALGFCFDMVPAIKRLYHDKKEQAAALKRHMTFFNVTPACVGPVLGVTAAMEEAKANGAPVEDGAISSLKIGLMGPLCGVGDPIFWGTLRPITAALGASMAVNGSILGPILFFVLFNAVRLASLWFGLKYGYDKGLEVVLHSLGGNLLQKITEGATILGMFVMGALVSKWTVIKVPIVVSRITGPDGKEVVTTVQTILDQLMPGLLALALTLVVCKLLRKNITPITLIFGLFAVGIIGAALGILE